MAWLIGLRCCSVCPRMHRCVVDGVFRVDAVTTDASDGSYCCRCRDADVLDRVGREVAHSPWAWRSVLLLSVVEHNRLCFHSPAGLSKLVDELVETSRDPHRKAGT